MARYTRKIYEETADVLAAAYENGDDIETIVNIMLAFSDLYATDNPRFDRAGFADAVWPQGCPR